MVSLQPHKEIRVTRSQNTHLTSISREVQGLLLTLGEYKHSYVDLFTYNYRLVSDKNGSAKCAYNVHIYFVSGSDPIECNLTIFTFCEPN